MKTRVTVAALIENLKGEYLLCKMPHNRGVYPGQWAIPGGGIEPDERMVEALRREIQEEVGLEIFAIQPVNFQDDERDKLMSNGTKERMYMIHLAFEAKTREVEVKINDEFEEFAWVPKEDLVDYDLNQPTRNTLKWKGFIA